MRGLSFLSTYAMAIALLVLFQVGPSSGLSIPEIDSQSQAYLSALKAKHGTRTSDPRRALDSLAAVVRGEDWPAAVRQLEELTGRAIAGQSIPGTTAADLLHRLGQAWRKHKPTADEGLWAAYVAQTMAPRTRGPNNVATLVVIGEILLEQINALRGDFDYRGFTLTQITERLATLQYGPARVATEDAQGLLPSEVRELLDLKFREERERTITIDKITARMAIANATYQELAKSAEHADLGDEIKRAIDKKLFYVKRIYADARRATAAICIEFNLPLRPDAGEYQDMVQLIAAKPVRSGSRPPAITDRTVREATLCLHGLRHGSRYHVLVKKGLPSKSGALLSVDFDTRVDQPATEMEEDEARVDVKTGVIIPDRNASAGFRSAAFILPKFGAGSIPLMTVNVDRVDLELVRLSDRTLYRPVALGQIGNDVSHGEFKDIRAHFSDAYWVGGLDLQRQPNETITTDIPVRQILDARKEFLSSIKEKLADEPLISEKASAGPARGHFRVDKLSVGAAVFSADQPGIYALLAKARKDFNIDDEDLEKSDSLADDLTGAYVPAVRNDDECKDIETGRSISCRVSVQWFVLTDLGLSYYMGADDLYVVARSLSTGKPVREAKVQLVAANNRVLAESETDSSGVAKFNSRLARGTEGNRLAALTASQDADFSFINFGRDVFDLSDHGTAGRRPPRLLDAYIYPDRGVYRPEESIYTTVLVRDSEGNAPPRVPFITVKLRASNGKIIEEKQVASADWHLAGAAVSLSVPPNAPLGQADVLVYLGSEKEPIGATTVQLDHFRPDRARITFVRETDWRVATSDQAVTVQGFADAQYLYGIRLGNSLKTDAPAANLAAELALLIQPAPSPFPGCYGDFRFGRIENDLAPVLHRAALPNRSEVNGDIALQMRARLPSTDLPLQGRFTLTLFDEGGKVGQHSRVMPIPTERQWLGVHQETRLLPGREGVFQLKLAMLALDPKGQLRPARLKYRIWRERNIFLWHQDSSSWRYQPDVQRTLVKEDEARTVSAASTEGCRNSNGSAEVELPLGRYYIEVTDDAGPRVTLRQDAGWAGAGLHAPTPDRATIFADARKEGDHPSYRPGDIATFTVEAPFDGEVLVAIANDRVHLWDTTARTENGRATVKIKIDPGWAGSAFYALATVFRRNADDSVERGPSRAMGALYFAVDREAKRRLKLTIDKQGLESIQASRPISFALRAEGIEGRAWATVYAVDEGLLSLSDHPVADPFQHFFGRRALALKVMDNYGRILLADRRGRDRSGGDRSARLFLTNYTSDRIVSQFTGPIEFINGVANIRFEKPFELNGTIRIVAVAWTEKRVGAAVEFVVQRQPIVASLSTPRFLTPGDRATLSLKLRPVDVLEGRYRISLLPKPPLILESIAAADRRSISQVEPGKVELDLTQTESRALDVAVSLPANARAVASNVEIRIEGAAGRLKNQPATTRSFDVAVRPTEAPTHDLAFMTLKPNESVRLGSSQVLELAKDRFLPRNLRMAVYASADPLSVVRLMGTDAADPQVGMLERLVWRGMLMLYGGQFDAVALAGVIRQIESLQAKDGYYVGYRLVSETGLQESRNIFDRSNDPVGQYERHEIWRTALAADFLMQARASGARISEPTLQLAVAALRERLRKSLQDTFVSSDASSDEDSDQEIDARLRLVEDKDSPSSSSHNMGTPAPSDAGATKLARPKEMIAKLLSQEPANQNEEEDVEDTSKPFDRDINACNEDMLYATFVLARGDAIDRFDLDTLMQYCSHNPLRPIGAAMLAAALYSFGVLDQARGVLTSIEARAGSERNGSANERFDAMMLAFLTLADASEGIKTELVERLTASNRALSLSTRAWLARAYSEPKVTLADANKTVSLEIQGQLPVETRSVREIASESVNVAELDRRGVALRNVSSEPLTVALRLSGFPVRTAGAPASGIKIARRVLNQKGETIDLQRTRLKPNDIIYVLLSGQREQENNSDSKMRLQDPIVIVDRLPASFEIVDRDLFEFARSDGVNLRAVLPSDGKVGRLRVVEARDDQLLAVVKPTSDGRFQIGYSVRVILAGQFIQPGTVAEDLYRSDQIVRLPDNVVQVESGARP